MSDDIYGAREQGRRAALAGRPIFANPHIAGEAVLWFVGYREVPEAERGSQPAPASQRIARRKKGGGHFGRSTRSSDAGVRALGDKCPPGSTPRPWVGL